MKIIFFGSDDFAVEHLKKFFTTKHKIVACVTPPDRPKGRGMKVAFSEVKECALKNNIPVLQPMSLKDISIVEELKNFVADLFIVIAYGRILPSKILSIPRICGLNVHASLLPKYRGAAPIHWAIIHGETETGISIIRMNPLLDAGDIVAQERIFIGPDDNSMILRTKLMQIGAKLLIKTIDALEKNQCTFLVQDSKLITLAPKLTKELGCIDWHKSAREIHNLVRGLLPWPTAYTFYQEKMLKILATEIVHLSNSKFQPGEVIEIKKEGFVVGTGRDGLFVKDVHPSNSCSMDAASFVRGYQLQAGDKF